MDERGRKAQTSMARCRRRRGLGGRRPGRRRLRRHHDVPPRPKRLSAARGTTPALCHWDGELGLQRNILMNKWLQRRTGDRRGRKTFQKNCHFVPHCWDRRPDTRPRREAHDRRHLCGVMRPAHNKRLRSKSLSERHLHVGRGSSDPWRWHTRPLGRVDKLLARKWRPPFFSSSGAKNVG